jgi:hypothetical protein
MVLVVVDAGVEVHQVVVEQHGGGQPSGVVPHVEMLLPPIQSLMLMALFVELVEIRVSAIITSTISI